MTEYRRVALERIRSKTKEVDDFRKTVCEEVKSMSFDINEICSKIDTLCLKFKTLGILEGGLEVYDSFSEKEKV